MSTNNIGSYGELTKISLNYHMTRIVKKTALCICENKGADQLCGNREADQGLCFPYIASTILLFPKYKISSL